MQSRFGETFHVGAKFVWGLSRADIRAEDSRTKDVTRALEPSFDYALLKWESEEHSPLTTFLYRHTSIPMTEEST